MNISEPRASTRSDLVRAVEIAGAVSLAVLGIVGRRSYQRKVVQLNQEIEKMGIKSSTAGPPLKVWAVLTPQETIRVFTVPLMFVLSGSALVGVSLKKWYGINDMRHAMETLRWVTRTGPPPHS